MNDLRQHLGHLRLGLQKENKRERKLALDQVCSYGFTQDVLLCGQIKSVIRKLECNSQIHSIISQRSLLLVGCSAKNSSDLAARRKEVGRFAFEDVKIFVFTEVDLSKHSELDQFTLSHFPRNASQNVEDLKRPLAKARFIR